MGTAILFLSLCSLVFYSGLCETLRLRLYWQAFLYIAFYFVFSMLGNFNYFFFAAHLMDVAVCIKTLGTILQSVTHNGKQVGVA